MVLADAFRRGYRAAIPVGEDWPFDLIVERRGKFERVQCKYAFAQRPVGSRRVCGARDYVSW